MVFLFVYPSGGKGMDVHGVMHDFEWAMINSIEKWFKCDYHLGCFFHWKQAIRHNLIEKGFKRETVAILLPMFDFLTVINRNDIEKGVEYIRENVKAKKDLKKSDKKLFDDFLDQYFIKTWLKKKLIDMFNYNDGEGGKWRRDM
jgi:hypothetical protein